MSSIHALFTYRPAIRLLIIFIFVLCVFSFPDPVHGYDREQKELLIELCDGHHFTWPEYVRVKRSVSNFGLYRVWISRRSFFEFVQLLKNDPDVLSWEVSRKLWINRSAGACKLLDPCSYSDEAGDYSWLKQAGVDSLQPLGTGSGILVAVADTGLDLTNQALLQNLWPGMESSGLDFNTGDQDSQNVQDLNGHGSMVSKVIIEVARDAYILPIKINQGSQNFFSTGAAVEAFYLAVEAGADVINLSFAGPPGSEALARAAKHAYESGTVLVGAAGNIDFGEPGFPAALSQVISVGSVDQTGHPSVFSPEHGVEILAPGENILLSGEQNGHHLSSGTSISAAIVSGFASVLLSRNTHLQPDNVRLLLRGGRSGQGPHILDGSEVLAAATPRLHFEGPGGRQLISKRDFQILLYLPPLDTHGKLYIAAEYNGYMWLLDNHGVWHDTQISQNPAYIELPFISLPMLLNLFGTDSAFENFSVYDLAPGKYCWTTGIEDDEKRFITPLDKVCLTIGELAMGIRFFSLDR